MSATWTNTTQGSVDEKLGIIALKVPFTVSPAEDRIAAIKHAHTFWPAELDAIGLPLVKREVQQRTDGGYDVAFLFDGKFDPSAEAEEFELDGTTSREPIESHPQISGIIELYDGERKDDGRVIFPLDYTPKLDLSPSGASWGRQDGESTPNPMHRTDSWLMPGCTWTRTFTAQVLPANLLRALGCIDTPAQGKLGQKAPVLEGQRNWLLARVRAAWRGNVWKVSMTWQCSGPGGWNPDVYQYR